MLELREFFVEGADRDSSHVLLHITEPSTPEEKERGYFFAITEIENGSREQIEHLQNMIDDLESGYYETDETNKKSAFEITLEYINKRGHHILKNKKTGISIIVGIVKEKTLAFAYHGKPTAKLISLRKENVKVMSVIDSENNGTQLFSSVMEGRLGKNDLFFAATPQVEDVIDNANLKKILSSRTPKSAANYFSQVLNNERGDASYGGIICSLEEDGLSGSITKEEEKIALPSKKPTKTKPESNYRPRRQENKEALLNLILMGIGRSIVSGSVGLYKFLKKLVILLWKLFVSLFLIITNRGGQRTIVLQSFHEWVAKKKKYITNLPIVSKILFVATIAFALVFVGSVGYLRIKEGRAAKLAAYNNQIQAIVDKQNAAEASMIYGDDSRAFTLLQEAKDLLVNLDDKDEQKNKLSADIEAALLSLRKIETVSPTLIADLDSVDPGLQLAGLAILEQELYVYGKDANSVYMVSPATGTIEKRDNGGVTGLIGSTTPKEDDKIVFLNSDNRLAEYNTTANRLISQTFAGSEDTNLSAVFVYNQRLYGVGENTIKRYNDTQTGYDRGNVWLKENDENLQSARSLAIDGDIFVLTSNEVLKYSAGNKESFTITGLDPKLDNPTSIWTYNDVTNIYILEPINKRLIVLDKNGNLLTQYTANEWQNPISMIIEEDKGNAYVLDNNQIYSFSLK